MGAVQHMTGFALGCVPIRLRAASKFQISNWGYSITNFNSLQIKIFIGIINNNLSLLRHIRS
jgi:hypothetical protein